MSRPRKTALAFLGWLSLSTGAQADAPSTRVVVAGKLTVDDRPGDDAALAAAAERVYAARGMRVVELSTSLAAQRAAFADTVASGRVPDALTSTSADVLVAPRLRCAKSSAGVLGSKIVGYACALDTRVVRVENGDVLSSAGSSVSGHGVTAELAVRAALEHGVPEALATESARWEAKLDSRASWELDVVVLGLRARNDAQRLATWLGESSGAEARILNFRPDDVRMTVRGNGAVQLAELTSGIETRAPLPLRVTFQSDRVLHVEYDVDRATRAAVVVVHETLGGKSATQAAGDGTLEEAGAELVQASIANLPFIEVRELWATHGLGKRALPATEVTARARAAGCNLTLRSQLSADGETYSQTFSLLESASGRALSSGTGSARTPLDAIAAAAHALAEHHRAALSRSEVRRAIGLGEVPAPQRDTGLEIRAFRLDAPQREAEQLSLRGVLTVGNSGTRAIDGAEVAYTLRGQLLGVTKVPRIEPQTSAPVPVQLQLGPSVVPDTHVARLAARVRYPHGDGHSVLDAVAPWVVPGKKARPAPPASAPAAGGTAGLYRLSMAER